MRDRSALNTVETKLRKERGRTAPTLFLLSTRPRVQAFLLDPPSINSRRTTPWGPAIDRAGGGGEEQGYGTCAQAAVSTKRRETMGSSVAYKTRGTFVSQKMGHEAAGGQTTDHCKAVDMQRYAKGRS